MLGRTSRVCVTVAAVVGFGLAATGVAQAMPVQVHPTPTWQTNGRVNAIAFANGIVYIGGQFTSVRPAGAAAGTGEVARNHVAAFTMNGGKLVSAWNPNANGTVRSIRVVGSTVYLGGAFTQVGGAAHVRLAAVNTTNGAPIASWKASASGEVFAIANIGQTLYVAGHFGTVNGTARGNLASLNATTGALGSWAPTTNDQIRGLRVTNNGTRIIAGGWFTQANGTTHNHLAAFSPTTGASLTWNTDVSYPVIGLAADANGVYVAGAGGGGNFGAFNPSNGAQLWQGGTNGNVQAIAVVNGEVYVGGHFQTYCGPQHGQHTCTTPIARDKLLAVKASSGALETWAPGANSALGVFALNGDPSTGDVFAGGDFTSIGLRKQQGYAQFLP
jgi:hypothetical protein